MRWTVLAVGLGGAMFAACSSETNPGGTTTTGGGGDATTVTSSTTPSTTGMTTGGPASTSATMMAMCQGLGAGISTLPDCGDCAEQNCCQELEDGNGMVTQELADCLNSLCVDECSFPPGIEVTSAPECAPAAGTPSNGACVMVAGSIECNPVTNEPCDTAGGAACDATNMGGFVCFGPPNNTDVCGACSNSNGPFCLPGHTCVGSSGTKCAKYCCSDDDCAPGTCFTGDANGDVFPPAPGLGVCIPGAGTTSATTGAGGGGGAGGGTGGAGGAGGN